MIQSVEGGTSNPHDLSLHKQLKGAALLLKPEVSRLHTSQEESNGKISLYQAFIDEIKLIRNEISNCDALYSCHNILDHMEKAIQIAQKKGKNKEILAHLQEVMALVFKVQNLPS